MNTQTEREKFEAPDGTVPSEQTPKMLIEATRAQDKAMSSFDEWQRNPYTKVLQDSIANDYEPKQAHDAQAERRDAERYRWIRDHADNIWYPPGYNGNPNCYWQIEFPTSIGESLDAAIDVSIASKGEKE